MKERPILMSAFSVRTILAGRKSQTRRIVKPQPELGKPWGDSGWTVDPEVMDLPTGLCPRGVIRERLWVRETFGIYSEDEGTNFYVYRADYDPDESGPPPSCRWTPSIFMPRGASRILLEITKVRVEQVQDINEQDAIVEGFPMDARHWIWGRTPQAKFKDLWNRTNEKRGFGWKRNPWVWAISFRRLLPKANG